MRWLKSVLISVLAVSFGPEVAISAEKPASVSPAIPGNPPRTGVAGKTGTYQIVFDNGAIVTLDRVELLFRTTGPSGPSIPVFKTYYKGGQTGEAQYVLNNARIIGIFLMKEDLNTLD